MSRRIRVLRAIRAGVFGHAVQTGLQLFLVPLYLVNWGIEQYGIWLMISTIPAYLLVSDFGVARTATAEVTMKYARGEIDSARQVYETVLITVLLIIAVLIVFTGPIIYFLPESWFSFTDEISIVRQKATILCIVAYGAIIVCGSMLSPGYQATGNYAREVWLASTIWLIEGLVTVCVLMLIKGDMADLAIGLLISRALGFTVQAVVMRRTAKWLRFGFRNAQFAVLRTIWRPSVANMTIPVANALLLQGTALAVGWGASAAAVPAFIVCRSLTRFALQLSNGVTRSTAPEFASAFAIGDVVAVQRIALVTSAAGLLIGIFFGCGLAMYGSNVIQIWTAGRIEPSGSMIALFSVSLALSSTWVPSCMLLVSINRQSSIAFPMLLASITGVVVAYIGSMTIGPTAGALGILIVDLFMVLVSGRIVVQVYGSFGNFSSYLIQTGKATINFLKPEAD